MCAHERSAGLLLLTQIQWVWKCDVSRHHIVELGGICVVGWSGDVVDLDLGHPEGREAGFLHSAIVITAQRILDASPTVVHVVPLTSNIRMFHSEILIEPDNDNGLNIESAAQCQHLRAVSPQRIVVTRGNIGPLNLPQIRETLAVILDIA